MVRESLMTRWYERGDRSRRVAAAWRTDFDSVSSAQYFLMSRTDISELVKIPARPADGLPSENLFFWISLAANTLLAIFFEVSRGESSSSNFLWSMP